MAAKSAVVELTQKASTAEAMAVSGMHVAGQIAAPMPWGVQSLMSPNMWALHKAGLLPEWVTEDIDRQASDMARSLTPDIAAMRSVSLATKYRMNYERARQALWANIEKARMTDMARRAFWSDPSNRTTM